MLADVADVVADGDVAVVAVVDDLGHDESNDDTAAEDADGDERFLGVVRPAGTGAV